MQQSKYRQGLTRKGFGGSETGAETVADASKADEKGNSPFATQTTKPTSKRCMRNFSKRLSKVVAQWSQAATFFRSRSFANASVSPESA
ncbi:hypothetical protein [Paraburkholderia ultramafica]|uniref:hypothetical protein n=1 Tax=Paraburkholderia ultramafica TaxID=1544867 RepID=UPI0015817899|nr:hypothetical protein [Paraburkholderia ultramafica]